MSRADNQRRRGRAAQLIDAYCILLCGTDEDLRTIMVDMVADLRHLARSKRIDFDGVQHIAEIHYTAEVQS